MLEILYALSAVVLGIFAGAQILEGVLLLPYWKAMEPRQFMDWYWRNGKSLYKFFSPLTITATIIPVLTAIYSLLVGAPGQYYAMFSGIFAILFFSTYFLYFKKANASFADGSLKVENVSEELKKWGRWHWGRIVLEVLALISALVALGLT